MSPPPAGATGGPGEPTVPAWLRGLPRAPEYRPTESEFADPIAFLSRVEREAAAYGICKVIPPYPRPSRRFVFAHLNRSLTSSDAVNPTVSGSSSSTAPAGPESAAVFTTRHQELGTPRRGRPPPQVLKQVWQSGEQYTLEQFEAKSRAFSKIHLAGLREPTALEVESLFWKASADRPIYIEYANDVPGSGFAAPPQSWRRKKRRREGDQVEEGEKGSGWRLSGSPWNLQAIARAPGSLTRFMPDDVPGVTSPMVYIGMLFSWFAWHVEDHELHSLNFLHTGAPKTWYAVPGDRASELEEVIRVHGYGGNPDRLASLAVLGEKTTLMSPDVLVARGVPCCRLVQYPGEFVVTFPRAYHIGFSHGFNCGEAANFATPQWLKFAKEAAVRRAVMNHLPMLSHQQLLYLLAVSFITRTPSVLSGLRMSRLRDRRKEERELLVKQEFLQDMISENKLLCSFLKKKSINDVVLWEPDLLPSSTALNSCSSGSKAPEKKSEDSCRIESSQCNYKDNSTSDGSVRMIGTQTKCMSGNSKSSDSASACMEKPDTDIDDEDDLPFDLSIDSGSLTCVACGILGYPFMAILQPSRETLERISLVHRERYKLSSEKENCCPAGGNFDSYGTLTNASAYVSGCSFVPNRPSCSAEQPCLATPVEQANIDHQNVKSHKDVCLAENELAGPVQQCSNSPHSCRSENTLHSCSKRGKSDNTIPKDSLGPEVSKQTVRGDIDAQAVESCDGTINWNTSSTFARPRIFCLQHALEIEELLEGKGGVHALIICHSDYIKLKALAISIAEEIEFQFDCTDVSLANASKSDLHLINISIDDEGHEEDGRNWTSQIGLNLKYCAKLRKETSGNQEQSPLSVWGLFSNPSPVSVVPNLKWLCKKARTPYKVIGIIYSSGATAATAIAEEVKPEVKEEIGTTGYVCEDDSRQHTFQQNGLLQLSGLHDSDGRGNKHLCSESGHDRHCLIDIPIAVAEYPMKHQVCEGPVNVSRCNDSICSSDSQDSPPLATSPVDVYQGCIQSSELSNSTTFSVQQFLNDKSTSVEGSINCLSNNEYLESQDVTLRCRDEWLQVQKDQEEMGLCNNPNRTSVDPGLKEDLVISEEKHGITVSATLENEEGCCAKTSNCSDTVIKTNESATVNQLENRDVGAVVKQKSSCDEMTCSADIECSITFGCLGSADVPGSTQPLLVPHDLMSDELQIASHHCVVKAIEPKSNDSAKHGSPQIDNLILEDAQAASTTAIPGHDGKSVHTGSNSFDILLGALAEESKGTDPPGKDEVGKASLTLMTLASNDHAADSKAVEVVKTDTILGATKGGQQVDQPHDFHLSDLVSRSIGHSNRTGIICYVRRKHKRKRVSQSNTDSSQSFGGFVRSPCESLRPRTKPAVVETMEVSAGKKGKRTKVGSFQCDIDLCDMTFETRAELNAHKRNICTDESCGKRFSSHKYLKRHQCVHSEIRPFKCHWDGCEMTFKWLWAQTEHVRVHTGERPYKCSAPSCGQTFRYVSDYSRHRKKFNHY
ncbi:Lysine-specific demethylase SE14 [Dichanthelium oligosanthes]|uniref:Lysine-specific demethylase SE14 n=1 Tax=Dichanthelium oligosanthes TaxID=888268 RepID=A0A1E5WNK4_9POAL|nr:Lysine-specific demethylase SE14 [Dichanthelium oligosanthes]